MSYFLEAFSLLLLLSKRRKQYPLSTIPMASHTIHLTYTFQFTCHICQTYIYILNNKNTIFCGFKFTYMGS